MTYQLKRKDPISLYFIATRDCTKVKIGTSKHPETRLVQLQEWSPILLDLWAHYPALPIHERAIHALFRANWSHKEWFHMSPQIFAFVARCQQLGRLAVEELDVGIKKNPLPNKRSRPTETA